MKKLLSIVVALLFVLGVASLGLTAEQAAKASDKCVACHKGEKALDKVVAKKKIAKTADFLKAIKEGPSKQVHAKIKDDEAKAVAKELKLAE